MAQRLQLGMSQQLKMSPQLHQAIHMLQLSTEELNQEIQRVLESNVVLEIEENEAPAPLASSVSAATETEPKKETEAPANEERLSVAPAAEHDVPWEDNVLQKETLTDYLLWQLRLLPLSTTEFDIGEILIRSIKEDGFLSITLEEVQQFLLQQEKKVSLDQIEKVLKKIHLFDPTGVGARDLKESLLLQLAALPQADPNVFLATCLVSEHFEAVVQHNYASLCRIEHVSKEAVEQALNCIQHLNPRPGASFQSAADVAQQVTPDVIVKKKKDTWQVYLNPNLLPKLRLSAYYIALGQQRPESSTFIHQHLQEGRWFMKCLNTRNETLLRVAGCIVERQKLFMEYGRGALKPLILQDVADALGLHPSTISRISTRKYIQTPRGTFELKSFFSSALKTSYGETCSAAATQSYIEEVIRNEDAHKPISDENISKYLGEQGIHIARRTVTKYREMLSIPAAFERKKMHGVHQNEAG